MIPVSFLLLFLVLIVVGVPIVFALVLAPAVYYAAQGDAVYIGMLVRRTVAGIDQFPVMAIPFFILAGEIMNRGGITRSLINLSEALVGFARGGLAQVNILTSILFAGLSGSAVADTSAVGSVMVPAMEKSGYSKRFAAAVTAASSVIGPIIPPSGIMIIYAFVMNVSVASMFAAGIVPGALVGVALMLATWRIASKRGYGATDRKWTWPMRAMALWKAIPALLAPAIILGGIIGGVFTPTEAAAVAVGYSLLVSMVFSRTLKLRHLPSILYSTAVASGAILLLVGTAVAFGSVVSLSGVAAQLSEAVLSFGDNPLILLLCVNVALLVVGMFLDAGPAILILGPMLAPAMIAKGVDPLHFAIVMCVNLTVGLATPPVGLVLFAASSVAKERVEHVAVEIMPFLAVEIAVVLLVTFFPALSLTIPNMLGLH